VTFTLPDRKKCTFQVLKSQLKSKRQIEADIFRAILSPEVSKIVFTAPHKQGTKMVKGIHSIIQETLLEYGINEKTLPIAIFIEIPSSVKSKSDIVAALKQVDKRSKLFL
jgi:hypothetical protein